MLTCLFSAGLATPVILAPPASDDARPIGGQAHTMVHGYHPYWGDITTISELSGLTHIAVFDVGATSEESRPDVYRWTSVADELAERAHSEGVKVHLCVTSSKTASTMCVCIRGIPQQSGPEFGSTGQ